MNGWDLAFWITGGLLGLAGLLLTAWSLLHDRSRGRRRCPRCWYDMSAVPGLKCPECGKAIRSERSLLRTRRHWRPMLPGILLLFLAGASAMAPAVISGRWVELAPPWALNAVLSIFDASAEREYKAAS